MIYRIANLIQKELIQVVRDWLMIVVLVVGPVLQLSLLAWATGKGVANLPLAVLDMDHSATSRGLALALANTKELALRYYPADLAHLDQLIESGDANIGVIIPPQFESDLATTVRKPEVMVIGGAVNNIANSTGLAAAEQAINDYLSRQVAPSTVKAVDLRVDVQYNPTMNSRLYTIPAMIGLIVFELCLMLASLGLTREREIGTLEQLLIMPFQRIELIIGKAVPPFLLTMADFPLMLLVATQVFGTPLRGSLVLLFILTALFMAAEVGWGLLLSTMARTQQQAVLFVFVQAIVDLTLSGFLVPVENLPQAIDIISNVVPLRHYLVIIRSIMLKGATLSALWPHVLALAVLTIVIGTVAVFNLGRRFD